MSIFIVFICLYKVPWMACVRRGIINTAAFPFKTSAQKAGDKAAHNPCKISTIPILIFWIKKKHAP